MSEIARLAARMLAAVVLVPLLAGQQPPPPAPAAGTAVAPAPAGGPGHQGEAPAGARRGNRAGGQGHGESAPPSADADDTPTKKPKEPRQGLPIDDMLVRTHCARCHQRDERGMLGRLSFLRKSPEGWSESVKRMVRLHDLKISPADARQIVRYLANFHGLTRSEAERSLYESERRVHWSEEALDQDFRQACAQCHTLGRVLAQARDAEEWQQLRNTHVAMFPLARGQMGGGPPPDPEELARQRERMAQRSGGGQARAGRGNQNADQGGPDPFTRELDRGDRVLQKLAKDQPLITPEWERWTLQRREVPLAGTWTVTGHEVSRGDLLGTCTVTRTGEDEYDVRWELSYQDGGTVVRTGKGLLYSGYSWRGRSEATGEAGGAVREVLLLDEAWQVLKGRLFRGEYDELGCDVTLHRRLGVPRVFTAVPPALTVPALGAALTVHGEAFPTTVQAADFHLGKGVTVTAAEWRSATEVRLTVDVAADTACGGRTVAFGNDPGSAVVQLYDQVDYVRVAPTQGFARTGGTVYPKQYERFEAVAVHRGKDQKPFTDDDQDLFTVKASFRLAEFAVREGDDDVRYVGQIDPATGLFTPSGDGPNRDRKWQANNVGDVFVEAEATLPTPVRKPKPKPPEPPAGTPPPEPEPEPEPEPVPQGEAPKLQSVTFHARAHLLVTVPLYTRWTRLDWNDR